MLAAQIVQMAACAIVVSYAAALAGVTRPAAAHVSGMRTTNTMNAPPATAASVRNVAGKP